MVGFYRMYQMRYIPSEMRWNRLQIWGLSPLQIANHLSQINLKVRRSFMGDQAFFQNQIMLVREPAFPSSILQS